MKKALKSCTLWFVVLALLTIWMHQIGRDSHSIMLIQFNPLLLLLARGYATAAFMNSGPVIPAGTVAREISLYWYFGSVCTMALYGLAIDLIRMGVKRLGRTNRTAQPPDEAE